MHLEEVIRREVLVKDWGLSCGSPRSRGSVCDDGAGKKVNDRKRQVLVDTLVLFAMLMVLPADIQDLGGQCSSSGGQAERQ